MKAQKRRLEPGSLPSKILAIAKDRQPYFTRDDGYFITPKIAESTLKKMNEQHTKKAIHDAIYRLFMSGRLIRIGRGEYLLPHGANIDQMKRQLRLVDNDIHRMNETRRRIANSIGYLITQ